MSSERWEQPSRCNGNFNNTEIIEKKNYKKRFPAFLWSRRHINAYLRGWAVFINPVATCRPHLHSFPDPTAAKVKRFMLHLVQCYSLGKYQFERTLAGPLANIVLEQYMSDHSGSIYGNLISISVHILRRGDLSHIWCNLLNLKGT